MVPLNAAKMAAIEAICPGGVVYDVDLSAISQWQIGGRADVIVQPSSTEELVRLRRWFYENDIPHVPIGLTSNLLFADEGLRAPCVQIGARMAGIEIDGTVVRAQAGTWVPGLARRLMQKGLTGGEHICGIPGTLGGLLCMNGGSQRKGIGLNALSIESVDQKGQVILREGRDCGFAYRQSVYQTNGEIITAATLTFDAGKRVAILGDMRAILAERRGKYPRKEPNCGSVFKSNPAMYKEIGPPGAVIERLGFKGRKQGGAMVSLHHANFIVNTGGAQAHDVLTLITEINDASQAIFGQRMAVEVIYVQPDGNMSPADSVRLESNRDAGTI